MYLLKFCCTLNIYYLFLTGNFSWVQIFAGNSSSAICNDTQSSMVEPNITYFSIQSLKQVNIMKNE